jgi:hypothetical protein
LLRSGSAILANNRIDVKVFPDNKIKNIMNDSKKNIHEDSSLKENNNQEEGFTLELYKGLQEEIRNAVDKVPNLWNQKLAITGTVVSFVILNRDKLEISSKHSAGFYLIIIAYLSIPLTAVLLDAKLIEYALHARALSKFIFLNIKNPEILSRLESCRWGDEGDHNLIAMVRIRSFTTVIIAAVPTILLFRLSSLLISTKITNNSLIIIICSTITFIYMSFIIMTWHKIWNKSYNK